MPDESELPPDVVDPRPGEVIEIPEWGYRYGSGTLVLQVEWVSPLFWLEGGGR